VKNAKVSAFKVLSKDSKNTKHAKIRIQNNISRKN